MAASDFVVSARQKLRQGDVAQNRANSEAVQSKISGNINYILDRAFYREAWAYNGYFESNGFDDGVGGIRYIKNDSDISDYYLSIRDSGSAGNNIFNVKVYDQNGAFVNNLFGSAGNRILVSGSNGTDVVIGKKDIDGTPVNFAINDSGHTIQYGTLNLTTLLAGYVLVPFIESNGTSARNLYFDLRLKEQ